MRWVAIFFIAVSLLLMLTGGCSESMNNPGGLPTVNLPAEIAGIWQGQDSPFQIELSPEGRVLWAVIMPGEVRVVPNQITKAENQDGSFGEFDVGDCTVGFDPVLRELTVEIVVRHLYIPFPDDKLEGSVKHAFVGIVSEDGKTWETTWMEFFDYGPRFPMDPEGVGEPVTFLKVTGTKNQ